MGGGLWGHLKGYLWFTEQGRRRRGHEDRVYSIQLYRLTFIYHKRPGILGTVKNRWSHSRLRSDHLVTSLVSQGCTLFLSVQ
jgi:hypothetical protein